jgi:hypothetical protein
MERTQLVQRLKAPEGNTDVFGDDPYVNSGGIKNWGLTDRAMTLLKGIVRFDYMGAAEFEWGAIPAGLKKISDYALVEELTSFVISIPLREVGRTLFDPDNEPPEGNGSVWVICHSEDAQEVSRRIRGWAANDSDRYDNNANDPGWWLKECTHLNAALRPHPSWPSPICGWIELDNGFFFFTNKEMYERVCYLFGVKTPETS